MKPMVVRSSVLLAALCAAAAVQARPAASILADYKTARDALADQQRQIDQLGEGLEGLDDIDITPPPVNEPPVRNPPPEQPATGADQGLTLLGITSGGPDPRSLRVLDSFQQVAAVSRQVPRDAITAANKNFNQAHDQMFSLLKELYVSKKKGEEPETIGMIQVKITRQRAVVNRAMLEVQAQTSKYWEQLLQRPDYQSAYSEYQRNVEASPHDASQKRPITQARDEDLVKLAEWMSKQHAYYDKWSR